MAKVSCQGARRALVTALAALSAIALFAASDVQAQAPKPKPKTAPKTAPKSPPAAQAQPPAAPAQAAAPPQIQFVSSPWVKLCETQPKKICVTRSLLRTAQGQPAALAEFAEPEGAPKLLRITLPLGMLLKYGTRILIDQTEQPYATAEFVTCLEGCITFYQVSDDLQDKLKKGKTLYIQAINLNNTGLNFPLPLTNFAKAIEGPATDPKVYAEQQKKFQEELQKSAQPPAAAPQH
ncbi:MAG TPA: invasion associated locus B family protein [Xanthobacteraceae bacterium]|nr:invasion associated locus B family protein [Xanthobacteraceae bacterium]